jgi:nitroimidazol reductase NimA-like FMN-containing flavoprotein (pyridoxamine 5'-phosphate oxidase superfamily)
MDDLTKIRRAELAVHDDAWIVDFLRRSEYGVLALCRDGQPFTVARNFVYDPEQHVIYLHGARKGRTFELVRDGARANFNVSRAGRLLPAAEAWRVDTEYAGVVVFGFVQVVEDLTEARRALELLLAKYFPHLPEREDYRPVREADLKAVAVLRLKIEAWSGKQKQAAPNFPGAFRFGERV